MYSKKGSYIPISLRKEILLKMKDEDCDEITQNGLRCSRARNYKYQNTIKKCSEYCDTKCEVWMGNFLSSFLNDYMIGEIDKKDISREVLKKLNNKFNIVERDNKYIIILKKESSEITFKYRNNEDISVLFDYRTGKMSIYFSDIYFNDTGFYHKEYDMNKEEDIKSLIDKARIICQDRYVKFEIENTIFSRYNIPINAKYFVTGRFQGLRKIGHFDGLIKFKYISD